MVAGCGAVMSDFAVDETTDIETELVAGDADDVVDIVVVEIVVVVRGTVVDVEAVAADDSVAMSGDVGLMLVVG